MAKIRRARLDLHERADQRGPLAAVVVGQRERLGLRQEELADIAGCSTRFVHDLETGKPTVQLGKVLDVLDALGLGLAVVDGPPGLGLAPAARHLLDDPPHDPPHDREA